MSTPGGYITTDGRTIKGITRQWGWCWTIEKTGEVFIENDEKKALARFRAANRNPRPAPQTPADIILAVLTKYFGDSQQARDFMRSFAACTLSFPPPHKVEKFIRDDLIFAAMERDRSPRARRRISELFGVTLKHTNAVWQRRTGTRLNGKPMRLKGK